ncbi:hypothetical protein AB0L70_06940 [Kribbella sp. NPDC051952]|uniref:hypothetical protein n=1 Tax=Kribbella sp. NPDC051952 TaxID=3154851 RepID=UPI00344541A3
MAVVLLQVPEFAAEELIAAKLAVRSPGTRNGPEAAMLIVTALGAVANTVAIITSVDSLGELVRRLRRQGEPEEPADGRRGVTIEVTRPDSTKIQITIKGGSEAAIAAATKELAAQFAQPDEEPHS